MIEEHPVVEGEVAQLMESGEALKRLSYGGLEEVAVQKRAGRDEWIVVEHRLNGVPVCLVLKERVCVDPITDVDTTHIVKIVYGFSQEEGVAITEPGEIEAIIGALRAHTHDYLRVSGGLRYRTDSGEVRQLAPIITLGILRGHGCTLGLYFHLVDGTVRAVSGHAEVGDISNYEINSELAAVMTSILASHGASRKSRHE